MKEAMEQEFLLELWTGEVAPERADRYFERFGAWSGQAAVILINCEGADETEEQKFIMQMKKCSRCFGRKSGRLLLMCLFRKNDHANRMEGSWIEQAVRSSFQRVPSAGISSWKDSWQELPSAVQESRIALQQSKGRLFCYEKIKRVRNSAGNTGDSRTGKVMRSRNLAMDESIRLLTEMAEQGEEELEQIRIRIGLMQVLERTGTEDAVYSGIVRKKMLGCCVELSEP